MAFTITTKCISNSTGVDLPVLYIRADSNNPTSIETGETKTVKFFADGTFYALPAKAKITVMGATKGDWIKNANNSEGTLTISNPTDNVIVTVKADPRIKSLGAGPYISPNQSPLDPRVVLNKAQMPLVNDGEQPDSYFAVCRDDNLLYSYNKSNTVDTITGKFRLVQNLIEFKVDGGEVN